MTDLKEFELTEVEQALVDSLKTVIAMSAAIMPAVHQPLVDSFAHQRDGCIGKQQPKAAAVFAMLHQYLTDPAREQERRQALQFLKKPPAGSA
jgi:hypothetical protein